MGDPMNPGKYRFPVKFGFIILLVTCMVVPVMADLTSTPSPTFLHDRNNTGQSPSTNPPVHTPDWIGHGGTTRGYFVYLSPVYGSEGTIYTGNYDKNLTTSTNLPPIAAFTADVTNGITPFAVRFTDTSTGSPASWAWNFGDGTTSPSQNPVHTYTSTGCYTVHLTATNTGGSNTTIKDGYITVTAPPTTTPRVTFRASPGSGKVPLTVRFHDTSTQSPTAWLWDFGDGNTSTSQNPTYTYLQPGNYTVTLAAKNEYGSSRLALDTLITVYAKAIKPGPGFAENVSSGVTPLVVQFKDMSVGPEITGWTWDFNNDGIIDSTDQNPVCVYNLPGNYSVNLTVTNPFGTKTVSQQEVITVGILAPVVAFTANSTAGFPPLAVQFNDTATGPEITGWIWDFNNDGIIDSTDQNPVCVYNLPGNYTVNLIVTNTSGTRTISQKDVITVGSLAPIVTFTAHNVTGIPPLAVQFNDTSTGLDITGWAWDFNSDGIIDSTAQNPLCVYYLSGNYTVDLTVTNAFGSNTSRRAGFVTVTNGAVTAFTANPTSGTAPLAVQFNDTSVGTGITGWAWDFNNDGIIDSTDQNPVCVYNLPGDYTINLTITNAYGSNTTSKKECIIVRDLAPATSFTATNMRGIPPLAVQFNDTSTSPDITGWAWDFNNDGSTDSTDQNPICVYYLPGNYTVNLTVTNIFGTTTTSQKDFVTLSSGAPTARFSVNRTAGSVPLAIQFKDTSFGPNKTAWTWDFNNDGMIDSTDQNPPCVYNLPGNYTINFTVTNAYGSNTIVRKGFVTVIP